MAINFANNFKFDKAKAGPVTTTIIPFSVPQKHTLVGKIHPDLIFVGEQMNSCQWFLAVVRGQPVPLIIGDARRTRAVSGAKK